MFIVCQNLRQPLLFGMELAQNYRKGIDWVFIGITPEEAKDHDPIEIMRSSMITACLFRHLASGAMYIDILTCTLNIVDMGFDAIADDHPIPTLQGTMDLD